MKIDRVDGRLLAGLGLLSVMSLSQVHAETILTIVSSLSLLQLLSLKIRGSVLIDSLNLNGWKGKLPFYVIRCQKHGYQLTYPSGYSGDLLCPRCDASG